LRLLTHLIYIGSLCGFFAGERLASQTSAYLLPEKNWEVGLFQAFRYGFSDKINYSTHPILFFAMPNFSIKVLRRKEKFFSTATQHSVYYPTKLLKILQAGVKVGDETASLIAPNFKIPHMIGFSSDYIISKPYKLGTASLYGGVNVGLVFGELDERTSIDLPLVYHRLGVFYNRYGIEMGFDFFKQITDAISCKVDFGARVLPKFSGSYSFEHKLLLSWQKSERIRFSTGYKYVNADFPYGKKSRLLPYLPIAESWVPMVDIQWFSKKQKK